jgi:hypothetical protein
MTAEIQPQETPPPTKAKHQHCAELITWDLSKTIWLRDVPMIFGEIPSSCPDVPPHRVTARLDGTCVSCSCPSTVPCTIEQDGQGCVTGYWVQTYADAAPTELLTVDRQYAWDQGHCGLDAWRVFEWGCVGEVIGLFGYDRQEAA